MAIGDVAMGQSFIPASAGVPKDPFGVLQQVMGSLSDALVADADAKNAKVSSAIAALDSLLAKKAKPTKEEVPRSKNFEVLEDDPDVQKALGPLTLVLRKVATVRYSHDVEPGTRAKYAASLSTVYRVMCNKLWRLLGEGRSRSSVFPLFEAVAQGHAELHSQYAPILVMPSSSASSVFLHVTFMLSLCVASGDC